MENISETRGYSFQYEVSNEESESTTDIFFLHGWCSVRYFWKNFLEEFHAYGRCVNFDFLGHYTARVPEYFYKYPISQESIFEIQKEAIAKVARSKKVTLVGHSAGGFVVLGIAALFPDFVEKVVAICPPAYGPVQGLGLLYPAKLANEFKLDFFNFTTLELIKRFPHLIELWFTRGSAYPEEFLKTPGLREFLLEYHKHFSQLDVKVMNQYLKILDKCNLLPLFRNYHVPTLLFSGEKDIVVPKSHCERLASKSSAIQHVNFLRSAHLPMFEEKELFLQECQAFLSHSWQRSSLTGA
ncbi:MAG: alpha/beta hydrolase [Spirochaetota bacterium]